MAPTTRSGNWRVWHRWLSLIFGVQMVIWALSGAYMVFFDLDYIHGDHLVKDVSQPVPQEVSIADTHTLLSRFPDTQTATLRTITLDNQRVTAFQLTSNERKQLVDAETLTPIALTQANITDLATQYYAPGNADIATVSYLTDNPPSEISPRMLPVWQVRFNDFGNTHFYLSESTGELLVKRHTFWRGFDFVWMLHIMDYEARVDIQTWWFKAFIAGTVVLMITGMVLLVYTIRFKRMRAGGVQ